MYQFQDLATLFCVNIHQQANENMHTIQTEQLPIEQKGEIVHMATFLELESHSANVALKGDTSFLVAPQTQHDDTYPSISHQI